MGGRGITIGVDFPQFDQRRVTANEYFSLADDGYRYEVFEGVMRVSPSRSIWHQAIIGEIIFRLTMQMDGVRTGKVMFGSDINVTPHAPESPTIYCPDALLVWNEDMPPGNEWISRPPAIVIEVATDDTRDMDTVRKPRDYARFGVAEYWLIDPARDSARLFRNEGGEFELVPMPNDRFICQVAPGFEILLEPIWSEYRKWHKG